MCSDKFSLRDALNLSLNIDDNYFTERKRVALSKREIDSGHDRPSSLLLLRIRTRIFV